MDLFDHASPRRDSDVQDAVRSLLIGVAPEREAELHVFLDKFSLRFNLLPDSGRCGTLVMDAGGYRDVRFNHRVLRAFWVATFAAWEGYRACAEADEDLTYFQSLLDCVQSILDAEAPEQVPLPAGVPVPGEMVDGIKYPQMRAAGELAIFAGGWALLHEIRHCQHQQEGTSTSWEADSAKRHGEELSCDGFATEFVLSELSKYAYQHSADRLKVEQKRQLGVSFALFSLTVISRNNWDATETHPSMQDRIDAIWNHLRHRSPNLNAMAISRMAFATLQAVWPGAPEPLLSLQGEA